MKADWFHPATHVMMAPIERLREAAQNGPPAFLGVIGGVFGMVVEDAFTGIALLLLISGLWDTIYGRIVHKKLGTFDPLKAEMGLHSKVMGILLAFMIRGFELWWTDVVNGATALPEALHTHGFFAVSIAVTLFVKDLKSIEEKRERFGQGRIPILGAALSAMDAMGHRLFGIPRMTDQMRRRESDPASDQSLDPDRMDG